MTEENILSNVENRLYDDNLQAYSDCLEFKLFGQHLGNKTCHYCSQKEIKQFNYEGQYLYQVPFAGTDEKKIEYLEIIKNENQQQQEEKDNKDPQKIFEKQITQTLTSNTNNVEKVQVEEKKEELPKLSKPQRQDANDSDSIDDDEFGNDLVLKYMRKFQDCRCCQGMVFNCKCNDFMDNCICVMNYKELKEEKKRQKEYQDIAKEMRYKF